MTQHTMPTRGELGLRVGRTVVPEERVFSAPLAWTLKNARHRYAQSWRLIVAKMLGIPHFYGTLSLRKFCADGSIIDYGIVSRRVVTTAFVNYAVDAMQADQAFETFNFHAFGEGTTAAAITDTGLETELTTEYATDNTRLTGTQTEGASANIYRTVATLDPDAACDVTEHGILRANTGATTLLDRTVFTAIPLGATGDTLEATYDLTIAAGG